MHRNQNTIIKPEPPSDTSINQYPQLFPLSDGPAHILFSRNRLNETILQFTIGSIPSFSVYILNDLTNARHAVDLYWNDPPRCALIQLCSVSGSFHALEQAIVDTAVSVDAVTVFRWHFTNPEIVLTEFGEIFQSMVQQYPTVRVTSFYPNVRLASDPNNTNA